MSQKTPDAWDAEWTADTTASPAEPVEPNKAPGKVSKAQKRAQQAEFNRQLWQRAEGPQETNYFLESRNIVPLRSEFKPPPILLSRKGPSTKPRKPLKDGLASLRLQGQQESSSEDEDAKTQPTLAERQAQATKDREEKQRKYEERRQELFGSAGSTANKSSSGKSSPANLTPPTSRSATPSRGRGKGRGRGGRGSNNSQQHAQPRPQSQGGLFEPAYAPKPDSTYLARRENGTPKPGDSDVRPQRAPKGPDGSGRGSFGFAARREGKSQHQRAKGRDWRHLEL